MVIMNAPKQVYTAMSGGVDSAVAAAELKSAGYQVTGIHMTTWVDPQWKSDHPHLPAAVGLAQQSADALEIPLIVVDVQDRFYETVVQSFLRGYLEGKTPNPCLFCNPRIKWGILQQYALDKGADFFATGHYARVDQAIDGQVQLLRGLDRAKDQSYVLSMLTQTQLQQTLLPLGSLTKTEVRVRAASLNLPVSDQVDSQDLCFLGKGNYRDFLKRNMPESIAPGEVVNLDGHVLGEHRGLPFYTIGQRKGIKIAASEPYYVVGKDLTQNRLVVSFADQTGQKTLVATQANWISGQPPAQGETVEVMIRYRSNPVLAQLLTVSMDGFRLEFKASIRDVTPGQVAVLYQGEIVLGGGVIQT